MKKTTEQILTQLEQSNASPSDIRALAMQLIVLAHTLEAMK